MSEGLLGPAVGLAPAPSLCTSAEDCFFKQLLACNKAQCLAQGTSRGLL